MPMRAYLLVSVVDDMGQDYFIKAVRALEEMQGVEFVDPVTGSFDMIIMVEAPLTIETLVKKINSKSWVRRVEVLRVVSIFERCKA
ncbi:MAG: hypothetical protein KGZ93_08540 [Actinobacteria bacterium]|nr:hypothetical protein [Actinomycetota bacterium]